MEKQKLVLLDTIWEKIGCNYLSDLHIFPYNIIAKAIFKSMDLQLYTLVDIENAYKYIFES